MTRHNGVVGVEAEFYRELGRKLEAKRKERGWNQQSLAAEIGCHRNTLMRYESGEQVIPLWMLLRVCDILCCQHLLLLPAREYTWGALPLYTHERDPKKGVQAERDKPVSDLEYARLTRRARVA
jgi:DNA-binding XRE family transcriptional regulator